MAAQSAFRRIGRLGRIQKLSGGIHHQAHLLRLPVDLFGIARGAQEAHFNPIDAHTAVGFIQFLDHGFCLAAVKVAVKPAIGGIPLGVMGDVAQAGADLASNIHYDFGEVFPGYMVPDSQLADAAESVDSQLEPIVGVA